MNLLRSNHRKYLYIGLGLLLALAITIPAYAGYTSGTDPEGETLFADTWFDERWDSVNYVWDYYGKAQTWRSDYVYLIRARGEFYNDCDYWHEVADKTVTDYGSDYVDTGFVLTGSTSCSSLTEVYVDGTHLEQLYSSGGPWYGLYTEESEYP